MTYISRRTRISDPRWLDGNEAEFLLRAARKRSDGRLKRHSSCEDLRGWINNNCIKHEYLVDLMSDGEMVTKSHVRLFGRFIPVSVLVDILKNVQPTERKAESEKKQKPEKKESDMRREIEGKLEAERRRELEEKLEVQRRELEEKLAIERRREVEEKLAAERRREMEEKLEAQRRREQEEKLEAQRRREQEEKLETWKRREPEEKLAAERRRELEEKLTAERRRELEEKLAAERRREIEKKKKLEKTEESEEPEEPEDTEEPEEPDILSEDIDVRMVPFQNSDEIENNENNINRENEILRSSSERVAAMAKAKSVKKEPSSDSDKKEKQLLEEMLCECMNLLCKAVGKLEKIDTIVSLAQGDLENSRNEEIQGGVEKSKTGLMDDIPSKANDDTPCIISSRKKLRDSVRNKELMRKISELREKLKKIQECRREINEQIMMSQQRVESRCTSSIQVTELYNRKEQALIKRLQANLERLTAEKGRLLCEMCHALNSLNSLKKSSKMSMGSQQKSLRTMGNPRTEDTNPSLSCTCGCQLSDNFESSESDRIFNSHSSAESYLNECTNKWRRANNTAGHVTPNSSPVNFSNKNIYYRPTKENRPEENRAFVSVDISNLGNENVRINIPKRNVYSESSTFRNKNARMNNTRDCDCQRLNCKEEITKRSHSNERFNSASAPGFYKRGSQNYQLKIPCFTEEATEEQRKAAKPVRRSNLKIVGPQSFKRKSLCGSMINFNVSFCSDNKYTGGAQSNSAAPRPNTSPTSNVESLQKINYTPSTDELRAYVPERKIKSETTMQEVEKALRNYEERLNGVNFLENRVEELRQRLSEAMDCRKQLTKDVAEAKKARAAEAEKSANETTSLSSENWELKRQIHQLAKKFEMQCKKIENLKIHVRRANELEVETETLRKELLGYRGNFDQQQKCITRLHSVVAVQRTEIENLMDHIRKLTAMREQASVASYPERKIVQKSRSFSPESGKPKRTLKSKSPGTRGNREPGMIKRPTDEESTPCFCPDNQLCRMSKNFQPPVEVIHCYPPQLNQSQKWT